MEKLPHTIPEITPEIPPSSQKDEASRFDLGFRNLLIFNLLLFATVYTTWLVGGMWFSLSLLLILGVHEFGHYWACRKNNVDASLPNFIPAPPFFLVGTFGAFIRIKEPIPNRRALMEIGASGPIAGFLIALPVLVIGISLSEVTPAGAFQGFSLGDSLITLVLSKLILGVTSYTENVNISIHPIGYAGWFGMFITAMNLLPIGQLDGGHVIFSLFHKHHKVIAKVFFGILIPLGYFWPGWLLFAFLILILGFSHPPLIDESVELTGRHRAMGYFSLIIFFLTFIPVPIEYVTI